jgi:hypothetical protein
VRGRDRADGLPHQHAIVGGRYRVGRRDRDLELAGRVFGVELLDDHALALQRPGDRAAVVRQLDHPRHAVGRAAAGRDEAALALGAGGPLHLEAHPQREPAAGGFGDHTASERALAAGVDPALLGVAVDRGEGPAGLAREHGDPVEVGDQPQVAGRAADVLAGRDVVVDHEHVEHRRHADAPPGGALEPAQRDRLDPGDAGVVYPAQRDQRDVRGAQPFGNRNRPAHPVGPLARGHDHGRGAKGAGRRAVERGHAPPPRHAEAVSWARTCAKRYSSARPGQ